MEKFKEVGVVAKFKPNQPPEPIKIQVTEGEKVRVIVVDTISFIESRNASGERFYVYGCKSYIGHKSITYYMQYWISTCLWQFMMINESSKLPRSQQGAPLPQLPQPEKRN